MKKNRLISLVLAVLMLTAPLFGCAQSEPERAEEPQATPDPAETPVVEDTTDFTSMSFTEKLAYDRSQISDNLPEWDEGGADFHIGFLDQGARSMYNNDWIAEEMTGEVLNDAVYNRNVTVEERFNIKIGMVSHSNSSYSTDFTSTVLAGDDAFDMASLHPGYYGSFTTSGYLMKLSDMDYLDFTKPWWMGNSIESLSYLGVLYVAFGAATSVTLLADSPVIFFNKDIATNLKVENLYEVVREGRWTYDYFLNLINQVSADTDGDGTIGDADRHGLHYPAQNQLYRYVWSLGGRYVTTNSEGVPEITIGSELLERVYDAVLSLTEADGTYPTNDYSVEMFIRGNTLFENNNLSDAGNLREVDFYYGILPNFKLDENQEFYLTNGGGGPQCIPVTCGNPDRAALIMEALNAEGYKQVIPAYYETAVKHKMTSDEDSAEMLDLIFSHVVYDGCRMFCEDATFMLSSYVSGGGGFASFMKSQEKVLTKMLEKSLQRYARIGE